MEVLMTRAPNGALIPISEDEADKLDRFRMGETIKGNFTVMRNSQFHRKFFSLLQLCFEKFKEGVGHAEYKGQPATPCFDTWRQQFVILSGHYDVTFDIKGHIRLKAKSLSFANCNQEEFEVIYSDLINCALKHVYDASMSEQKLRALVEQILRYA